MKVFCCGLAARAALLVQSDLTLEAAQFRKDAIKLAIGSSELDHPERRCDRSENESRFAERSQIDERNLSIECGRERVGRCGCDRRLADASGSDDRDEAMRGQRFRNALNRVLTPHHPSQLRWQRLRLT